MPHAARPQATHALVPPRSGDRRRPRVPLPGAAGRSRADAALRLLGVSPGGLELGWAAAPPPAPVPAPRGCAALCGPTDGAALPCRASHAGRTPRCRLTPTVAWKNSRPSKEPTLCALAGWLLAGQQDGRAALAGAGACAQHCPPRPPPPPGPARLQELGITRAVIFAVGGAYPPYTSIAATLINSASGGGRRARAAAPCRRRLQASAPRAREPTAPPCVPPAVPQCASSAPTRPSQRTRPRSIT